MLVHFYIRYTTTFGQSIRIRLDNFNTAEYLDLEYAGPNLWKGSLELQNNHFKFSCWLVGSRPEPVRIINDLMINSRDVESIEIFAEPIHSLEDVFSSKLFRQLLPETKKAKALVKNERATFIVNTLPPGKGKVVCMTGGIKKLGQWKEEKPLLLKQSGNNWIGRISLPVGEDFEYKIGIYDIRKKMLVEYEEGENRIFNSVINGKAQVHFVDPKFKLSPWRGAGINIAVSSLRSEMTWGTGDFTTLNSVTDLARRMGMKLIQLLPVNDTGATNTDKDSYPYSAISSFALHPLYLNVQKLATACGINFGSGTLIKIKDLNDRPELLYSEAVSLKLSAIKVIYEQEQDSFRDDYNWFEFFDLNREWLMPYAAFCFLRDKYGTADFSKWKEYSTYDEDMVQDLVSPGNESYPEIALHYFIQYHLHLQLRDAADYAHKQGVVFKGDLPIGVGRFSVDTWMYPRLFNLDMQAGAPPDFFTKEGQNWGFPTYNWDNLKSEGYSWWRKRLERMEMYFDAVRIDHVIGLLRIWSIPLDAPTAALGFYVPCIPLSSADFESAGISFNEERYCTPGHGGPADLILVKDKPGYYHFRFNMQETETFKSFPDDEKMKLDRLYHYYFNSLQQQTWKEKGFEHLTMIRNSTSMLLFAEDLGFVPAVTSGILEKLHILSMQVQRMPKDSSHHFSLPANAPYLSLVTPSTHDMSPIKAWWEEGSFDKHWYYENIIHRSGPAPEQASGELIREIIKQHLESPAMWSVFLLQDLTSIDEELWTESDERMNHPGDPDHNWNYRMKNSLEELIKKKSFTSEIKKLVRKSGR